MLVCSSAVCTFCVVHAFRSNCVNNLTHTLVCTTDTPGWPYARHPAPQKTPTPLATTLLLLLLSQTHNYVT